MALQREFVPLYKQPEGFAKPFRVKSKSNTHRFTEWKKTPKHKLGLVATCSVCKGTVSLIKPDPQNPDVEVWVNCTNMHWNYIHFEWKLHPEDCRQIIRTRHMDGTITEYKNPLHWGDPDQQEREEGKQ